MPLALTDDEKAALIEPQPIGVRLRAEVEVI
jgi:hypothetical protein